MEVTRVYREIQTRLNELTDEELVNMRKYIQVLIETREHLAQYDPENDPILTGEGLFYGPVDLSERVEEILYGEDYPPREQKHDRACRYRFCPCIGSQE